MKKHVFSYSLPFLISSPGVSMATKSLSGGSLSPDVLTFIKSLSLSFCLSPLYLKLLSPLSNTTGLFTGNLSQHQFIQTTDRILCPKGILHQF